VCGLFVGVLVGKGYEILNMPLLKVFWSDYGEGIGPSQLTWEMMTYSALIYGLTCVMTICVLAITYSVLW